MKRILVTVAAVAALGGALASCATPTPYQPVVPGKALSGGYSEIQLEPDRFRVTFSGNSLTSRQIVESYLLYRSAELTVAKGYDWFAAANRQTDRSTQYYADPMPFYSGYYGGYGGYGYGYGWRPYWRYAGGGYGWRSWDPWGPSPFWGGGVDYREINRYEATAEVVMGKGAKPAGDPTAFDARAVMANVGPHIVRPTS